MESNALAAREAKLAEERVNMQKDLDSLLAKQEERLRAWEASCSEQEVQVARKREDLEHEEKRYACCLAFGMHVGFCLLTMVNTTAVHIRHLWQLTGVVRRPFSAQLKSAMFNLICLASQVRVCSPCLLAVEG